MTSLGKRTVTLIFILASLIYSYMFLHSLNGRWFSPSWTTDDAVQQIYPFWKVIEPELYPDDLITRVMEGYLAPLHYWLTATLTYLTGNPVMASHWVMLIQVIISLLFLALTVQRVSQAWPPAFFACIWLLHTRTVIMRMTGGLPRGWAVPLLAGFVYCAISGRHVLMLLLIGVGCLLNPPTTFLIAFCYGLLLLYQIFVLRSEQAMSAFKTYILASPVFALTVWLVIQRPDEIGSMVSYQQASKMAAFNPGGRFPFLPLPTISWQLHQYGYNPFINRLYTPDQFLFEWGWVLICLSLIFLFILPLYLRRTIVPATFWIFLLGITLVYLASRQLLFHLYVPDRHLLAPLSIFLICTFSIGIWNLLVYRKRRENYFVAGIGLILLTIFIYLGSGTGLYGDANFNYHYLRQGRVFQWLEKNTDKAAVIAGHPTHVNPVTLYAKRKVYVSSEVAHPFYPTYYAEMERRIEISLRAHYARSIKEFLQILKGERIDYFVFARKKFYDYNLAKEQYYEPFNSLVKELASRHHMDYGYKQIPTVVSREKYPFLLFRDDHSVLINLKELRKYAKNNPVWAERVYEVEHS